MIDLPWILVGLPLLGFLINGLFKNFLPKPLSGAIGTLAVAGAFAISVMLFLQVQAGGSFFTHSMPWINLATFKLDIGFKIDQLSTLMMMIITGIGSLIHLYSMGYMKSDEGHNKFFAYLNLFIFFMLLLVMGRNYLIMFIGWEGVGLCSYLLIGFWNTNTAYNNAAKKAFVMNRIGDLGFLLGMFLIFMQFKTLDYNMVFGAIKMQAYEVNSPVITAICVLLFIGAMGKSAQIPLYTWLPDAMAGPTPVSALIHAATMVTAGIYMIIRSNILYTLSPIAQHLVLYVGLATAVFAAIIGLKQNDIKKVLAYSTVSQLGLMFMALGAGAFTSAFFHVTTHAFFKALLFLGAGSVIHAMHHQQDIRFMGGLKKKLPITFLTFLLGTLAIAGIPPFSGFFSKDEILLNAFIANPVIWGIALISSLITAIYMFRMLFVTFYGKFRGTHEQEHHLHESPATMTLPLIVLAILSVVGGVINLPELIGGNQWLHHWFEKLILTPRTIAEQGGLAHPHVSHATEWALIAITVTLVLVVVGIVYNKYVTKNTVPEADADQQGIGKLIAEKFRVDELYEFWIVKPVFALSNLFYYIVELKFIDFIVNNIGNGFVALGRVLRFAQNGNIGIYIFTMVLSVVVFLVLKLLVL